jgi:hypothetical protein
MVFYPLGVCHPDMSLDWVSDGVGDANEEELHRVKKGVRLKIKGKREVLNLKSSIDYGDASVSFRRRKGKA